MKLYFCRRCGSKIVQTAGHVNTCENGHIIYANASPATAVVVINSKNEVLTLRRSIDPGKGTLDFPGGFCDGAETLESCAYRELEEETGLSKNQVSNLQYIGSGIDHYNHADETIVVLAIIFTAHCDSDVPVQAGDDAESLLFIPVDELNENDFYFDSLKAIIPLVKEGVGNNNDSI